MECAAFILMTGIFYFYDTYIRIGDFDVGYQYIACLILITLGFGWFLAVPDPFRLYHMIRASAILSFSYVMIMLCTTAIWIFDFTPIRQMIRGFFEPSYIILCFFCAAFFVYILQDKAVDCFFWALSTALGVMLLKPMRQFGPVEFFRRLISYVQSGGRTGGGVSLEATNFAYLYAFFALYYLFHRKEGPTWKRLLQWGIIVFALLDTFKRSSLLALTVGVVIAFLYYRIPQRYQRLYLNFVVISFLICAFLLIPFIRSGLFTYVVNLLRINTSARTRIYAYYEQYYQFTPFYFGRGLGWISRLMLSTDQFSAGLPSVNVHCDYLRFYIELGFFGYLIWMITTFPWVTKMTVRGEASSDNTVILGLCVAMAILRITENISQLYSANLGISIIIIQCLYLNDRTHGAHENRGRG